MCITVQTHFHIFLNNRKLEFDGFEPLTVWLSFLIDMDFRNQRFHNLSLLLLVHDSVQLFKINQHFVDIVSSEFFCFYCHFLCSGFNQQILRILYLIIHFIKAIIKVCFTLDVVLIIWVKGINLINQTGLRSIALTKLFFIIGNLLFNGGCIYLHIDFLLHHRRKLRIADQFDNNLCNSTVQQFLIDLLLVFTLMTTGHSAVFAAIIEEILIFRAVRLVLDAFVAVHSGSANRTFK